MSTSTAAHPDVTPQPRGNGARRLVDHQPAPPVPSAPDIPLYLSICRVADVTVGVAALLGAFLLTNIGPMLSGLQEFLGLRVTVKNLLLVLAFALAWRGLFEVAGLYRWGTIRRRRAEAARVVAACLVGAAAASVFPALSVTGAFRVTTVVWFGVIATGSIVVVRAAARRLVLGSAQALSRLLVVGAGPRALRLRNRLESGGDSHYFLVGHLDAAHPSLEPQLIGRVLGGFGDLERILVSQAVDEVLVALPVRSLYGEIQEVLQTCMRIGVRVKYPADTFDTGRRALRMEFGDEGAVVALPVTAEDGRLRVKRAVDLVFALALLLVLGPVMLLAAAAVKLSSPGPVLFLQERYGYNRRRFRMFKFRSMAEDAEHRQSELEHRNEASGPVFKIKDDPRLTRVGRVLRRTSIDELPQLFNVLRGDMSIVGPRPLPLRDVHRFTDAALMRRFSVRPGLTCLWQIRGRSDLGFDEWVALDLQYIDSWSLALDFRILLATIPVVLRGSGAR